MAKLYFRYGAMNSGKSTALIQAAFNYEERGQSVLLAKPAIDTKGDGAIVSRLGISRIPDFLIGPSSEVYSEITTRVAAQRKSSRPKIACVLIDEAQFLSAEQVDDLLRVAVHGKIPVIAYGIRTDFQTLAFEGSRRLLEVAHSLEELKTICRCGRKAVFNARRTEAGYVFEGDQVAIEDGPGISDLSLDSGGPLFDQEASPGLSRPLATGPVTYESLCASCYLDASNNRLTP